MGISHSWNGTVLTVTSDSGTSSADLKGDMGIRGPQGIPGEIDTSLVYTRDNPPTAAEVGARAANWLPTLAEIGAAPSGFGYGEKQTMLNYETRSELLAALDNMLAAMPDGCTKQIQICCNGVFKHYYTYTCTLYNAFQGYATLEGITYSGICVQMHKHDGVWSEAEWVNPPMAPGAEYRTTERWNGKPVYTKLVALGTLPNATEKWVYHEIVDLEYPISFNVGAKSDTWALLMPMIDSGLSGMAFNPQYLVIRTTANWSAYTAYGLLRYTKK